MKPLTRHQRAAIYRQAAEDIIDKNLICGACFIFFNEVYPEKRGDIKACEKYFKDEIEQMFPEFFLFKNQQANYLDYWWYNDTEDNNCRILALLLSAEMTLNP